MTADKLTICEDLFALSSVLRSGILSPSSRDAVTTDEAAAIIEGLVEALDDARLFVELVRIHWQNWHDDPEQVAEAESCLTDIAAALAKVRTPHHPGSTIMTEEIK